MEQILGITEDLYGFKQGSGLFGSVEDSVRVYYAAIRRDSESWNQIIRRSNLNGGAYSFDAEFFMDSIV